MRHTLSLLTTDQEEHTAFINAALEGDTKKVRALLELGADINAQDDKGHTALMLAVINRHAETVKALLYEGADINARANDGRTAISLAASSGNGAMMRALITHRVETRVESVPTIATAIMVAARNGYAGIVKLLQKVEAVK